MSDTIPSQSAGPDPPRGLLARVLGVIFAPRATYAGVARHPRLLGALTAVIVISGVATYTFLSTEVGRQAALEQQLSAMASFGVHPTAEQLQQIERRSASGAVFAVAAQIVLIPAVSLLVAGIALAVFTAALGGDASFRQVYAIVVHSWFIPAVTTLFVLPLNYARGSLSGSTSLAIFAPMLDEAGFAGRLLGAIDLVRIWWLISLAIGLGVLYQRRTAPIAGVLLALYGAIALLMAGVMTSLSGA